MDFSATQRIGAPRQAVWDALFDPATLKACLPGCESVERDETGARFTVVVAATVGPLKARFRGSLRIENAQPPEACTMQFEGQGGAVGFGNGSADVSLAEADGGAATDLAYTARAEVGGKLAQIGSRLVDSVARKMADDFFTAFKARLAPPVPAVKAPALEVATPIAPLAGDAAAPVGVAATPAAVAASPSAATSPVARAPAAVSAAAGGPTLVPGWWLIVAAALGAVATALGTFIAR